jgi:hypothetical protein
MTATSSADLDRAARALGAYTDDAIAEHVRSLEASANRVAEDLERLASALGDGVAPDAEDPARTALWCMDQVVGELAAVRSLAEQHVRGDR